MKVTERTMAFKALRIQELTFNLKVTIQHGKDTQVREQEAKIATGVKDIFLVKLEL